MCGRAGAEVSSSSLRVCLKLSLITQAWYVWVWKGSAAVTRMHGVLVCERSVNRLNPSAVLRWQVLPAVSRVRKPISLPTSALHLNFHTDDGSSWWGARSLPSGAFLTWPREVKGTNNYSCLQTPFLALPHLLRALPCGSGHDERNAFKGSSSRQLGMLWLWVCL